MKTINDLIRDIKKINESFSKDEVIEIVGVAYSMGKTEAWTKAADKLKLINRL